jgi:hypothetical protein
MYESALISPRRVLVPPKVANFLMSSVPTGSDSLVLERRLHRRLRLRRLLNLLSPLLILITLSLPQLRRRNSVTISFHSTHLTRAVMTKKPKKMAMRKRMRKRNAAAISTVWRYLVYLCEYTIILLWIFPCVSWEFGCDRTSRQGKGHANSSFPPIRQSWRAPCVHRYSRWRLWFCSHGRLRPCTFTWISKTNDVSLRSCQQTLSWKVCAPSLFDRLQNASR